MVSRDQWTSQFSGRNFQAQIASGAKKNYFSKILTVGAWNIRTLMDTANSDRPERRSALVSRELARFNIDVAALSETRLADEGKIQETAAEYTIFWIGKTSEEPRIQSSQFCNQDTPRGAIQPNPNGNQRTIHDVSHSNLILCPDSYLR